MQNSHSKALHLSSGHRLSFIEVFGVFKYLEDDRFSTIRPDRFEIPTFAANLYHMINLRVDEIVCDRRVLIKNCSHYYTSFEKESQIHISSTNFIIRRQARAGIITRDLLLLLLLSLLDWALF